MGSDASAQSPIWFENPFQIEDLCVFDQETLHNMLARNHAKLTNILLAQSFHGVAEKVVTHVLQCLPQAQQNQFLRELQQPTSTQEVQQARQKVLDELFWELIYWKKPELYEDLTEGEQLHEGIFQALETDLRDMTVLDVGAGSGRASFECLRFGAARIYAVEPSPGLLRLLRKKVDRLGVGQCIISAPGRFDKIPLPDQSVDIALSCSAFTALDNQGGEPGLAELVRVTRPGGKIVVIWPRTIDHDWFVAHGFQYHSLPVVDEMFVRFRSFAIALRCAQLFYAHNPEVMHYLDKTQKPEIPFSVIGMNPPRDYFWLEIEERI